MARILDITRPHELCFWDDPGLAAVSDGRIAKHTGRERLLEPLQRLSARWAAWRCKRHAERIYLVPPIGPTPAQIHQLVWTTLKAVEDAKPTTVVDWM